MTNETNDDLRPADTLTVGSDGRRTAERHLPTLVRRRFDLPADTEQSATRCHLRRPVL